METKIQDQFISFGDSIVAYLPNLAGGLLLILLGLLVGWLTKKILIRLSLLLRVDRFFNKSRFEANLSKADVRYSFYSLIGNIGFIIIFLIFLNSALVVWKLEIISDLLSKGILFLPKVIIALLIFGFGWLLSSWVQIAVLKILHREEIPRASLISRFVKSLILIFFAAISLVQLDISRVIIIIGFTTIFVTLGIITIVLAVTGSKNFLNNIENTFNGKEKSDKLHTKDK